MGDASPMFSILIGSYKCGYLFSLISSVEPVAISAIDVPIMTNITKNRRKLINICIHTYSDSPLTTKYVIIIKYIKSQNQYTYRHSLKNPSYSDKFHVSTNPKGTLDAKEEENIDT